MEENNKYLNKETLKLRERTTHTVNVLYILMGEPILTLHENGGLSSPPPSSLPPPHPSVLQQLQSFVSCILYTSLPSLHAPLSLLSLPHSPLPLPRFCYASGLAVGKEVISFCLRRT